MKQTRTSLVLLLLSALIWVGCAGSEPAMQPEPATPSPTTEDTAAAQPDAPEPATSEESGPEPSLEPRQAVNLDTVQAGRFDLGKMWTFDDPPLDYFAEEYDFNPDQEWFEHARLGALRFSDYCSASFVSPNGLIATNHHCGRESVTKVSRENEDLMETGFYASTLDQERQVSGLVVQQLVEIEDVTDQIMAELEGAETPSERAQARSQAVQSLQKQMNGEVGENMEVQVISLYHGAQYSAYTFREYSNIRLVAAPELALGYFGGDPDNFTYPRYALDFSFFRAYNDQGEPLQVENYFEWSEEGASPGEAVFVVGNPGSTSRLEPVSVLEYRRDYETPIVVDLLKSRVDALQEFRADHPTVADTMDLRNTVFSLQNSLKNYRGQLRGLRNDVLLERRRNIETQLIDSLRADTQLANQYGEILDQIATVQQEKASNAHLFGAFVGMNPDSPLSSNVLMRSLFASRYMTTKGSGAPESQLSSMRQQVLGINVKPPALEQQLLATRFRDFRQYLGEDHPLTRQVLQGRSPEAAAEWFVENTALVDSAQTANLLSRQPQDVDDPALAAGGELLKAYGTFARQSSTLGNRESELISDLARARFEVYGTEIPPDATFSLRLADGRVESYQYNGTKAPPYTTFYGLYDHYHSYPAEDDPWELPEQWQTPPEEFDLSTPLNIVTTNDIVGGNSGSPLLNQDLEVVGLIFDGNIESLSGEFIYTTETSRAISVDARGVLESLDVIYDADRIVLELQSGEVYETEEAADAAASP